MLLTTHYLDEAEALCDRIAIIDRGRIVASGAPRELDRRSRCGCRRWSLDRRAARRVEWLERSRRRRTGVRGHEREFRPPTSIDRRRGHDACSSRAGIDIIELHVQKASLEDVFLELTSSEPMPDLRPTLMNAFLHQLRDQPEACTPGTDGAHLQLSVPDDLPRRVLGALPLRTVPLVRHIGELLTVTALGGACFGLPTTMVSERERGVWRRYRLAPVATVHARRRHGRRALSAARGRRRCCSWCWPWASACRCRSHPFDLFARVHVRGVRVHRASAW